MSHSPYLTAIILLQVLIISCLDHHHDLPSLILALLHYFPIFPRVIIFFTYSLPLILYLENKYTAPLSSMTSYLTLTSPTTLELLFALFPSTFACHFLCLKYWIITTTHILVLLLSSYPLINQVKYYFQKEASSDLPVHWLPPVS